MWVVSLPVGEERLWILQICASISFLLYFLLSQRLHMLF
ncbi:hypothetical protein MANES_12G093101v8 [Manihot esculenta]|uniref:Uncharacterized protein n=1 Tax=Manihot esculenta TaxID=3983 RepID=A0ACB7GQF4_MANES|nr:hypothetical protein MANES_12G093101v8 [Manihot esculenta]